MFGLTALFLILGTFHVETLSGRPMVIPRDLPPRPCILIVTFTRDAGQAARKWSDAIAQQLPADSVRVEEVAVLEDVPSLVRGFVIGQLRRSIPDARKESFLVATSEESAWKELAAFRAPNDPYLIAIDRQRQIVWRGHGDLEGKSLAALLAAVR